MNAAAVPSHERLARVQALHETLFALEVAEEKLIVEAERRGERIDRRADARPEIIFDRSVLEATVPPAA